jgi:hypothetical protein
MYFYGTTDFANDAKVAARTMHLAYRRARYIMDRWNAGMNAEYADLPDAVNFMAKIIDMCAYFEANEQANLKHVMALSDLKLSGD